MNGKFFGNIKKGLSRKKIMHIFGLICLIGAGIILGSFLFAAFGLPSFNPNQLSGAESTQIYNDKNQPVNSLNAGENRSEVSLDKIPKNLINAFIATEDQDFYKHHGVNIKGIARAMFRNVESGDLTSQGASTITQQLARNAFLSFDKTWQRKFKEILLAFKIESRYTKDEILTMYVNKINFGAGAYGVQAAATTYFGKDVDRLNLAECSLLAGLPQSPNAYNPLQYLDKAKARQKLVLNNMVGCEYITRPEADQAYAAPLTFNKTQGGNTKYGYYTDAVVEEAVNILKGLKVTDDPEYALYHAGMKIYTGMNSDLQSYAETVYSNSAYFPAEKKNGLYVQSAMSVVNHSNGEVIALMGGRSYNQQRGFNRATDAYRQPGSSIKPLTIYTTALEKGIMPYFVLNDAPLSYKIDGQNAPWQPSNYDGQYRGLITMRTGVQYSINTYAVQLADKIGIRAAFDNGKNFGLELIDKPGTNDLGLASLALGGLTKGATPVQMAAAYGAIANGGIYMKPHLIRRILDADGVEIYRYKPQDKRVISVDTAWLMNNMLQTVVKAGTGTAAQVPGVVTAGKTGTSEEYSNSWFCGFTPLYAAAVWMGYDRQDYAMNKVYGGSWPAPIFRMLLTKAHEQGNADPKPMPDDIIQVSVCSKSGKLPGPNCPESEIISEYCTKDAAPQDICDYHNSINGAPAIQTGNTGTPDKSASTGSVTVEICRDTRHGGQLVRANVPNALQTGGCPGDFVETISMPADKAASLPFCSLSDHQLKSKSAGDFIKGILDN